MKNPVTITLDSELAYKYANEIVSCAIGAEAVKFSKNTLGYGFVKSTIVGTAVSYVTSIMIDVGVHEAKEIAPKVKAKVNNLRKTKN